MERGAVTGSDPEASRLERYRRYNSSVKGQRRHKRYEAKHPERKERWSAGMIAKGRGNNYEHASRITEQENQTP
jgi:hypothetical protein